ncbi:MAG: VWA domain-containing protein [Myxococcales bacterium]|nr:VWA domain-containing protein [Myxococcales bacterium]
MLVGLGASGCAKPCFDDGLAQGGCPETPAASETVTETDTNASATQGTMTNSSVDDTIGTGGADAIECPELEEILLPQIPTFQLVVDQSGSMDEDFGGVTRWEATENTLVGNNGVVTRLQSSIRFGVSLYHNNLVGACPDVLTLPPQLDAADEISGLLAMNMPGGDTPTGESFDVVLTDVLADPWEGDKVIVLVTDGEPDTCDIPEPMGPEIQQARDRSTEAVTAAFDAGIRTFVIGVSTGIAEDHLQDLANAGVGATDAPFWVANDVDGLVDAFDDIVAGLRPCDFALAAPLMDDLAPTCEVTINDAPVPFDDPDGWGLQDPETLVLQGSSCAEIQEGVVNIRLRCPCES